MLRNIAADHLHRSIPPLVSIDTHTNNTSTASEESASIDTPLVSIVTNTKGTNQNVRIDRHAPGIDRYNPSEMNVFPGIIPKTLKDQGNVLALPLRKLPKLEDPGKFIVPCSIFGVNFDDALCDYGSTVNLMSMDMANSLRLTDMQPSRISLKFANVSVATPQGYIENLPVRIGNCLMPTDFQVVEISDNYPMPLIMGRSFLATAGALVDLPKRRVCLSNIDKSIFYDATPEGNGNNGSYVALKEKN